MPPSAATAHVLEHAVIDECERLAGFCRSQEDQAAKQAGAHQMLFRA